MTHGHEYIALEMKTLSNFRKRKHPRNGEKKKQRPGAKTKVQASQQPKRGESQGGKRTTKNPNAPHPPPVAWSISTKEREGK